VPASNIQVAIRIALTSSWHSHSAEKMEIVVVAAGIGLLLVGGSTSATILLVQWLDRRRAQRVVERRLRILAQSQL
jgi:hypothetical protein